MQPSSSVHAVSTLPCLIFIAILAACVPSAHGLIPPRLDGFWYEGRTPEIDSVVIEAFFDPVCPDSRDSWPPLKQALHHYGSRVSLVVHPFPLPYHDNAFVTSRALHIVNELNVSATYPLLEMFYKYQESFYNPKTFNMSRKLLTSHLADFVTKVVGKSHASAIASGFKQPKTDHATRISFKYGCSRGVFGTPFFFVNGFALPDAGSALNYSNWRAIIDGLGNEQSVNRVEPVRYLL